AMEPEQDVCGVAERARLDVDGRAGDDVPAGATTHQVGDGVRPVEPVGVHRPEVFVWRPRKQDAEEKSVLADPVARPRRNRVEVLALLAGQPVTPVDQSAERVLVRLGAKFLGVLLEHVSLAGIGAVPHRGIASIAPTEPPQLTQLGSLHPVARQRIHTDTAARSSLNLESSKFTWFRKSVGEGGFRQRAASSCATGEFPRVARAVAKPSLAIVTTVPGCTRAELVRTSQWPGRCRVTFSASDRRSWCRTRQAPSCRSQASESPMPHVETTAPWASGRISAITSVVAPSSPWCAAVCSIARTTW